MEGREARGRLLAKVQGDRIKCIEGPLWYVPASTGDGGYLVNADTGRCGCADESERCKHLVAVEIIRAERAKTDGAPVITAPAAPAPQPAPAKAAPMPRGDLTAEEQDNVRAALRFLRARNGGWEPLGKGTRFRGETLRCIAYGRAVGASVAVRLARFAGVPVDDVIAGRFPPSGACPYCGHVPPLS